MIVCKTQKDFPNKKKAKRIDRETLNALSGFYRNYADFLIHSGKLVVVEDA